MQNLALTARGSCIRSSVPDERSYTARAPRGSCSCMSSSVPDERSYAGGGSNRLQEGVLQQLLCRPSLGHINLHQEVIWCPHFRLDEYLRLFASIRHFYQLGSFGSPMMKPMTTFNAPHSPRNKHYYHSYYSREKTNLFG